MTEFAGLIALGGSALPPGTLQLLSDNLTGARTMPPRHHLSDRAALVVRQRIVTPEDRWEQQPSVSDDGAIVSLWDGRLDNRAELFDLLGLTGSGARSIPDGDLVRMAYQRWDEDAASRLLGDFAWAVWNAGAGRLMLARDHARQRILYHCRTAHFVAFATDYAPLLALPGITRAVDEGTIAQLLVSAPDGTDRSIYRDVKWVGSAMRIVHSADGVRSDRLWEPLPQPTLNRADDRAYLDAAREVFDRAVARRLRLAGPIAASISGGLDSSAAAVTAARLSAPSPVHCFCLVPMAGSQVAGTERRYADERPYVSALAARYPNLTAEYCALDPDAPAEIPFAQTGIPLRSPGNFLWFATMYRRAAEIGAASILDGGFGNITFSAHGDDPRPHRRRLRRIKADIAYRLGSVTGGWPWSDFAAIEPEFARDQKLERHYRRHSVTRIEHLDHAPFARLRYFTRRSRVQAEWIAAVRKLHGIVPADPYSDRRLLTFLLSLPNDQFRRDGVGRQLARRAFADRLTPEIIGNRRKGVQDTDWHARFLQSRDDMHAELDRLAYSPLAARIIDLPALRRVLDDLPSDPITAEARRGYYMQVLGLGLHVGQFLAWTEGRDQTG